MKSAEARDVALATGRTARHVTHLVRGVHEGISGAVGSVLGAVLGPPVTPILMVQKGITSGAYAATAFGLDAGARVAGTVSEWRLRAGDDARASLHDGRTAPKALAVALGLWGDTYQWRLPTLAPDLHVRRAGRRVEPTAAGVRAAYDVVTPQAVVFLHGLFETEAAWRLGAETRPPYADRLLPDAGFTPVMVRYNTGLRISDNGRALAGLLGELVDAWPVPVERIVLIGHSMGGLVLHSALHVADLPGAQADWRALVTDTITLGTPHHGSPIARGVHRLATRKHGRWLGGFLDERSAGVRDLAHGNLVEEDWHGHDPADGRDRRTHPPAAPGVRHHAVVAVAAVAPEVLSDWLGDLVVSAHSASHGETDTVQTRYREDVIAVVRGVTHLGLLNNDEVYRHIRRWLDRRD